MAKFYTVEKTINGVTYKAQFNGLSAALKAFDDSYIDGSSNTSLEKLTEYLFENVIVEPKGLTADDFASMEELNKVSAFARDVMQGKIKPETEKAKKEEK